MLHTGMWVACFPPQLAGLESCLLCGKQQWEAAAVGSRSSGTALAAPWGPALRQVGCELHACPPFPSHRSASWGNLAKAVHCTERVSCRQLFREFLNLWFTVINCMIRLHVIEGGDYLMGTLWALLQRSSAGEEKFTEDINMHLYKIPWGIFATNRL